MYDHVINRLSRALLIGLVLACTTIIAPSTVGAAEAKAQRVGCVGTGCSDQDANAMGCGADATTPDEFTATHAGSGRLVRVELRQSRACRARWLRVTPYEGSGGCGESSHVRMQDITQSGVVTDTRARSFGLCAGQVITRMVGRASSSHRLVFGYRSDPYGYESHGSHAPFRSQLWGAW